MPILAIFSDSKAAISKPGVQVGVAACGCPHGVESLWQLAGRYSEMPPVRAESHYGHAEACCDPAEADSEYTPAGYDHAEARFDFAEAGSEYTRAGYDHAEPRFDFAEACCDPAGGCIGRCLEHDGADVEHADSCFDSNALLFGHEHVGQG